MYVHVYEVYILYIVYTSCSDCQTVDCVPVEWELKFTEISDREPVIATRIDIIIHVVHMHVHVTALGVLCLFV